MLRDDTRPSDARTRLARWPAWIAYAAAGWSLGYGAFGLFWALGGIGFPYGRGHDPSAEITVFPGADPVPGGILIGTFGLVGGLVALAMARSDRRRAATGVVLEAFAWLAAAVLVLVVPDYRPLLGIAYAPIVILGAPFDWPPGVDLVDVLPWPVLNQLLCIVGGVLWVGAAVAYRRRARGACEHCGRPPDGGTSWTSPESASRWGRWATAVAVLVPLLYAATRFAWALGIPLGITEEFLREGEETGLWLAGAALASLAVGGAILTIGLIRPWGETFPRWLPSVGGRRVPPSLAEIPASAVALLVTSAGLMFVRILVTGAMTNVFEFSEDIGWVALAPELLWPVWGVGLAAATLAYHYRRRGRCEHCGRG